MQVIIYGREDQVGQVKFKILVQLLFKWLRYRLLKLSKMTLQGFRMGPSNKFGGNYSITVDEIVISGQISVFQVAK